MADRQWSTVAIALLPEHLGRRLGPSLKAALDATRNDDMAFCFREPQRGGEAAPDAIATWVPRRDGSLVLYLEAREGAVDVVDVVDARVARPGTLPPEVLECCREVLRGMEIKVPFAEPRARFRYVYGIEE
jgi:hypothetical protein